MAACVAMLAAVATGGPSSAGGGTDAKQPAPAREAPRAAVIPANQPDKGLVYDGLEVAPDTCKTGLKVKGTDYCTHGPDGAPAGVDVKKSVAAVTRTVTPQVVECQSDGQSGLRTQVIYARSSDVADGYAGLVASIQTWAQDADAIYNASAAETAGGRRIRFVHDAGCNVVVANAVMSPTGDDNFGNTITELQALGYNRTDRKYMLFVDAFVYCGIGNFNWNTDQPGPDSPNNVGPSYGRNDRGCWNGPTAAHEHMHNLGGVQLSAPFTSAGAHCIDEYDLMCYSDTPNFPTMQYICPDTAHDNRFDCVHNDYFNTNPPVGTYLRSFWNSAENLFLNGVGKWGYAWVNCPTLASCTPSSFYQRNSSGATNTVTRSAVGVWSVRFPNIGASGGTVNVSAYGGGSEYCKVGSWGQSGSDELVTVRCFTNAGVPVDTLYNVSFAAANQNPGQIAYAWANNSTSSSYIPSTTYQFNSFTAQNGYLAQNTITRSGTGNYLVYLPWQGATFNGHVKVTGYGSDTNTCKVGYWYEWGNIRIINVLCYNTAGAAADALFTVTNSNNISLLGVNGAATGYAWVDSAAGISSFYSYNSSGAANTAVRNGVGWYTVTFPNIGQNNGHVQVTAYGGGGARCKSGGWGTSGTSLLATVYCHDTAGALTDSYFNVSYTR